MLCQFYLTNKELHDLQFAYIKYFINLGICNKKIKYKT